MTGELHARFSRILDELRRANPGEDFQLHDHGDLGGSIQLHHKGKRYLIISSDASDPDTLVHCGPRGLYPLVPDNAE